MAELGFDGRVAIVTGAGGGLGREHALLLAARGARVVVNDVGGAIDGTGTSATPGEETVAAIVAAGGEAVVDTNSVATPEGGEAIVQTALDAFGQVDIVVNNAGILRDKAFHNMSDDLVQAVLDVHLRGAFNVTRPAWRLMREQQLRSGDQHDVERRPARQLRPGQLRRRRRWASSASPTCSRSRASATASRRTRSRPSPARG